MGARRFVGAALSGPAAICAVTLALAQEVHYSPEERLDAIDAALIATAKRSIDLASYALTDPIVLDALNAAELRGVVIRIVLDPRERHDFVKLGGPPRRNSTRTLNACGTVRSRWTNLSRQSKRLNRSRPRRNLI